MSGLEVSAKHARTLDLPATDDGRPRRFDDIARLPDTTSELLRLIWPEVARCDPSAINQLMNEARYAPYLERSRREAARIEDDCPLSPDADYRRMPGLSNELREKLDLIRPLSIGQAARIEGMTPAALVLLTGVARRTGMERSA